MAVGLYTKSGTLISSLSAMPTGSLVHRELMGDHYVKLVFSLETPYYFAMGDYVEIDGFGHFELSEPYMPKYNSETLGYDYNIQFDAYYIKWKNKVLKYNPAIGASETSFKLTTSIDTHLAVIVGNINALGAADSNFKYKNANGTYSDFVFDADTYPCANRNAYKFKLYESTDIISALNDLAQIYDCEWWVEGNTIYFGRCEKGTAFDFNINVNVSEMTASESKKAYANRLYAFGSTRNLHENYRRALNTNIAVGSKYKVYGSKVQFTCDGPNLPSTNTHGEIDNDTVNQKFRIHNTDSASHSFEYELRVQGGNLDGTYVVEVAGGSYSDWVIIGEEGYNVVITGEYSGQGTFSDWYSGSKKLTLISSGGIYDNKTVSFTVVSGTYTADSWGSGANAPVFEIDLGNYYGTDAVATLQNVRVRFHTYGSSQEKQTTTIHSATRDYTWQFELSNIKLGSDAVSPNATMTHSSTTKALTRLGVVMNYNDTPISSNDLYMWGDGTASITVGWSVTLGGIYMSRVSKLYTHSIQGNVEDLITEGVVSKRLMLPYATCPNGYVQDNVSNETIAIESVVVFEDVFPRTDFTVADVISQLNSEEQTEYTIIPTATREVSGQDEVYTPVLPQLLENVSNPRIIFQSGSMNGMDFECFLNDERTAYTLKLNEDYGRILPDVNLHPSVGDKFIVYGFDAALLDEALISAAEAELKTKAEALLAELKKDSNTYNCKMMSDWYDEQMEETEGFVKYDLGQRVTLKNAAYFSSGRTSRIIGYEIKLDFIYDEPLYIVGEATVYSKMSDLQNKIDSLIYNGTSYQQPTNGGVSTEVVPQQEGATTVEQYIGTTQTQEEAQPQALTGIESIQFSQVPNGRIEPSLDEIGLEVQEIGGQRVLHTELPFYSDSWVASGGIGSGGSSGGGGGTGGASALDDLTDVDTTGVSSGDVLTYDGQKWVAQEPTGGGGGGGGTAGVTSVSLSVPTGMKVNNAASATITSTGTFAITIDTGYSLVTTTQITNWNTVASNYLSQTDAASTYLSQEDAATIYLSQNSASSTYLTQSNAANTYLKKTDAASTYATLASLDNYVLSSTLFDSGHIKPSLLPDYILGQMLYGGTVNASGVVTLTQKAKDKYGISSLTLSASNYSSYEGVYFIASANGSSGVPSTLGIKTGDWIVSTGSGWVKIDNTDEVTSVNGYTGAVTLAKSDIGLGNVENTKLSTWSGSTNITTVGTISTGTWHGTAIADAYIASASTWNMAVSELADAQLSLSNAIAGNATRIDDIEAWFSEPYLHFLMLDNLDTKSLNVGGTSIWHNGTQLEIGSGVKAISFVGSLTGDVTGNASTASAWQTSRNFTITDNVHSGTTVPVNGTANVTLPLPTSLTLSGTLDVGGNSTMSGVLNITGVTSYAQGIRIHKTENVSSIWFGAVNETGFDAGMFGITLDANGMKFRGTATSEGTTPNDYLKILYGGNVGIGTSSPSYKLHVEGDVKLYGTTYLGSGTNYYLGNGAAESKLYSLTIGNSSSTQMSVTNGGIVELKASTDLGNISSYANSTATLKVGGGASINGNLAVYGKRIYFNSTYYIEYDSSTVALHTNLPFYSDSWVASGGIGSGGSGGGSSFNLLTSWTNLPSDLSNYALGAELGVGLRNAIVNHNGIMAGYATTSSLSGYVLASDLFTNGIINTSLLPSYVDDVLEYNNKSSFPSTGESGKIYVAKDTNLTYRWSGSAYVEISPSLALGETSATAYRGDRGKAAYEHSTITSGNPHGTTVALLTDTTISSVADGQALIWDATAQKWKNADISDVFPINNAVAENRERIADLEAWKKDPYMKEAYIGTLGTRGINLNGLEVWEESRTAVVGGNIGAKRTTSTDVYVGAENSTGKIALAVVNGARGVYDATNNAWVIQTDGTNTFLSIGKVVVGATAATSSTPKFYVSGTFGASGNSSIGGTLGVTGATTLRSTLSVTGETTLSSTLGVTGNTTLSGTLTMNGSDKQIVFKSGNTTLGYLKLVDLGSSNYALESSLPFYSTSWVASGGVGSSSGGGGGGGGVVQNVYTWNDRNSADVSSADTNNTFNAYTIKQTYQLANSALKTVSTTTDTESYMVTSVAASGTNVSVKRRSVGTLSLTLNGSSSSLSVLTTDSSTSVGLYAPTSAGTTGQVLLSNGSETTKTPTWGYADRIKTSAISSTITDGLNNQSATGGLFVSPFSFVTEKADKNTPTGVSSGVILRWNRYLGRTDGTINTEVQLLTTTSSNRLWFRNNWSNSSSSSTDKASIVWKEWLEVVTTGNISTVLGDALPTAMTGTFTRTYPISTDSSVTAAARWVTKYKVYASVYVFTTSDLVAAVYDSSGNQVMTEVQVVLYGGSSSSYIGKYAVKISFAENITEEYKLVVHGF